MAFFSLRRLILPIILGLGVATLLLVRNFDAEAFRNIDWKWQTLMYIFLALLMMVFRDLGYMYRIRVLTDGQISWRRSFDVIMLWEFASAVTPSVIGGSAVALYIVNKEGVNMGRTTAIVLITAFLDELFYILMVPLVILMVGTSNLFTTHGEYVFLNTKFGTQGIFILGYIFILILTSIIIYGVFLNPRGFKMILLTIFKIPFLRRWRHKAAETGNEIIITSKELRGKPKRFWLKAFGGTFISWTGRFLVVNFLILAFTSGGDQLLIFARQLVMWVILLISPTPGGSGVAEYVFTSFLGEFIPQGLAPALSLMWRLISYYPYLFIGAIVLPGWLKRVYARNEKPGQIVNMG